MAPADVIADRTYEPFCGNSVLETINALADFSHSKAMADLITAGKHKGELLFTLGKVGPPRYAHFIGRYKDDANVSVRHAVAAALGLIDNEAVATPVLIQLLTRADKKEEFAIRWEASGSLGKVVARKGSEGARRRVLELFQEKDPMSVVLGARALGLAGDAQGLAKLRELTGHAEPAVRYEAVLALGEIADKSSREVLLRRLKDDSLAVRGLAIFALGELGDPSVVPALRKAVEDSAGLEEKYGLGAFDLRETLQAALTALQRPRGR